MNFSATPKAETHTENCVLLQKQMLSNHYRKLSEAQGSGKKVVYTFVPGNLNELILSFDMLPVHPEINALQAGIRKTSGPLISEAEKNGFSSDVCSYVKCDIGLSKKGNIGPRGDKLPKPDLLLLSYTGCFTFLKWFEILREEYRCPVAVLHVPYQAEGKITDQMKSYVVEQLQTSIIPTMEHISGIKFDQDRLRQHLTSSAKAETDLVEVWNSAKKRPSPIDAFFGGVYYIAPIFSAFRGLPECEEYYRTLRNEVEERSHHRKGPSTPKGELRNQKYRLVVEGPPNWTNFRDLWKMFYDEGAVVVASTYTKVGGLYDLGFRHNPHTPLESLAEYCLGCYTNRNLPSRVELLQKYISDFEADSFLIHSVKSCKSFSVGQLPILTELEGRTGKTGGFIESDLVDPRYFNSNHIKNRLESYFQVLAQRKATEEAET